MENVAEVDTPVSRNGDSPGRVWRLSEIGGPEARQALRERWREVAGWSAITIGGVAGFLAWVGVSGKDIAPLQLPYLASGGLAAVLLTILGVGLLVSADLHTDRQRLSRLEGEVVELQDLVRRLVDIQSQEPKTDSSRRRRPQPSATRRS